MYDYKVYQSDHQELQFSALNDAQARQMADKMQAEYDLETDELDNPIVYKFIPDGRSSYGCGSPIYIACNAWMTLENYEKAMR